MTNQVNTIAQDKQGFIWVGTTDGLQRYDGIRFKSFQHHENDSASLPSEPVWQLLVDKRNNLWVLLASGRVGIFDEQNARFHEVPATFRNPVSPNTFLKKLISDDELREMKSILIQVMDNKKPFLDTELSLFKLASQLDISSHLLSYIINNGCNENFYQFINRYRIEEAKKMIQDPKMEHLSLMGIAFEVGFNSKTVFNTTFKKITNQTPSEFKKAIRPPE